MDVTPPRITLAPPREVPSIGSSRSRGNASISSSRADLTRRTYETEQAFLAGQRLLEETQDKFVSTQERVEVERKATAASQNLDRDGELARRELHQQTERAVKEAER